jgi:hypothetical protein
MDWRAKFFGEDQKRRTSAALHKLTFAELDAHFSSHQQPTRQGKEGKPEMVRRLQQVLGLPNVEKPARATLSEQDAGEQDAEEFEEGEEGSDEEAMPDTIPVPENVASFLQLDPISLTVLFEHELFGSLLPELEEFAAGDRELETFSGLLAWARTEVDPVSTNTHIVEGSFSVHDNVTHKKYVCFLLLFFSPAVFFFCFVVCVCVSIN